MHVGQTVVVSDPTAPSNGSTDHAAIVTRVWTQDCVNLTVFPDGGTTYKLLSINRKSPGAGYGGQHFEEIPPDDSARG